MKTAEENPFSIRKIYQLKYQFVRYSFQEVLQKWESYNFKGIIKGSEGVGKSTLLNEFLNHLHNQNQEIHYIFLNDESLFQFSHFKKILDLKNSSILLIDGFEQINFLYRHLLYRKINKLKGFLATSHIRTKVPTIYEAFSELSTFENIVAILLNKEDCKIKLPNLNLIFQKNKGNIRECLFDLYEHFANI